MTAAVWKFGCTECDEARKLVRRTRKELAALHEARDGSEARIRELSKTIAFMERELRRAGFSQHIWTARVQSGSLAEGSV